ncbi:hypothetical protein BUALT_Bualt05G0001800 [Buddleja alternifolia]|uniref:Protein kinase domain-containing protein n=1 Tax=Buddleja alternifolia TaxID=168488 RepID=A0AAV6XH60_9LAMI|nr:hypothetical protein BUALT_Bualt05G0001800 [Buddleja alternifolia]
MDPRFLSDRKHKDLVNFTNSFSNGNFIACFQFGKIYHGIIDHDFGILQPVTVKIWDTSSSVIRDNELRLMREVILLRNQKVECQPGAPKLLGYLCDGKHLGVIYDLKALNTVSSQLCQGDFSWLQRIKVAFWFARIVKFFHTQNPPFEPFVIHNIDATNILLDEDYIPKLFDYSLMTGGGIFPEESQDKTKRQKTGIQDDVFGFGVLLLSLITKQRVTKEDALESIIAQGCNLKSVSSLIGNKRVSLSPIHGSFEVDPYFYACDGPQTLELVMECLQSRPSMKEVVRRLQKLQVVRKHYDLVMFKPKPPNKHWG